jgi:thioredoxin 1/putative thioredoxin
VATGRLIPVDLRSEADFTRVHLPNAVSAPQEELQLHAERLADLQAPLLTYARTSGGDEAKVASLAQAGFEIYTLTGGLLAWEAERLPVQKTRPRMLD